MHVDQGTILIRNRKDTRGTTITLMSPTKAPVHCDLFLMSAVEEKQYKQSDNTQLRYEIDYEATATHS